MHMNICTTVRILIIIFVILPFLSLSLSLFLLSTYPSPLLQYVERFNNTIPLPVINPTKAETLAKAKAKKAEKFAVRRKRQIDKCKEERKKERKRREKKEKEKS